MKNSDKIIIIDFGSQYTKLIARRIRETNVYSEIVSYKIDIKKLKEPEVKAIILSGGPSSVYNDQSPKIDCDLNKDMCGNLIC